MRDALRSRLMVISIHAPRTGSDLQEPLMVSNHIAISIHAPRTGSDNRFWKSLITVS